MYLQLNLFRINSFSRIIDIQAFVYVCNQKNQENDFRAYPRQLSVTSSQDPRMLRGTINRSILGFAERIWGRMKAVTTDDCDYLEDLRKNQMGNVCVACALCYCLVTFRTNI